MKKSLSIVMIALLFVALGCNLDSLTGKKDDVPTPVPENTDSTADSKDDASDTKADDTDTSDTSDSGDTAASVSLDKFNDIDLGMSYDEVKGIMGSEGNQTSMTKSGSYESVSYEWKGDKFARISVRFQNGELVYKFQSGITTGDGTADINQAKFNKMEIGMTYDEVKDVLGSDGEMTSLSRIVKSTSASYRWKGPKYASIIATFKDDKLQNKSQSGLK